jgi:hypothetical protein
MTHPPEIDKDVAKMIEKGVSIYVVEEDARERGLTDDDLLAGLRRIKRQGIPQLIDEHEQVWHW